MATPRWTRNLRSWTCDACGCYIDAGEVHAFYPSTVKHGCRVACARCADGEQLETAIKAQQAADFERVAAAA